MSGGKTGQPSSSVSPASPASPADERFDEILGKLRSLVDKLESGNLPLEDGLHFFEEGMALSRRGSEILDRAEKRVEVLLSTTADGARVVPFAESGSRTDTE
jgi:exodeoxyribonuclease VII small subunit